ncbi:hypothetical protein [Lentzea sp. NPDC003310]
MTGVRFPPDPPGVAMALRRAERRRVPRFGVPAADAVPSDCAVVVVIDAR